MRQIRITGQRFNFTVIGNRFWRRTSWIKRGLFDHALARFQLIP